MNGYDATTQIRTIEREFKISEADRHYICGISANVDTKTELRCSQSGMDRVIPKPVTKNGIEDLIRGCRRQSNLVGKNKLPSIRQ